MKKLRFVPIVALLLCLLSVTALAAETPATELKPTSGQTYTVEYNTGAATNVGKQYVILILKSGVTPANLTVDSILYIDQTAADATGKVKFENFQLMTHISADVYIGGEGLTGPVNPYKIVVSGISVSGKVTISGAAATTIALYDNTGASLQSVQTNVETYELASVPIGTTYYIKASKLGFVGTPIKLTIKGDALSATAELITLYGGDTDCNTAINVDDLGFLLKDFGKVAALQHPQCDVDSNGAVNVDDLSFLLRGFGKNDISVLDFIGKL